MSESVPQADDTTPITAGDTQTRPGSAQDPLSLAKLAEDMRSAAVKDEDVSPQTVHQWVRAIESLLAEKPASIAESHSKSNACATATNTAATSATTVPAHAERIHPEHSTGPSERSTTFPVVMDHGRLEVRQIATKPSLAAGSLSSVAMCIYAILQAVIRQLGCERLSLYTPYRGSQSEFRLLCGLARSAVKKPAGSTILRGNNLMEQACMRTGYLINVAPGTAFVSDHVETVFKLKQPQQGQPLSRHLPPAETAGKSNVNARMCCPVKLDTLSSPVGVITVVGSATLPFDQEDENFIFDAALMVASLLSSCDDAVSLQKCFSQGDFRAALPSQPEVPIPSHGAQLVYRANDQNPSANESLRVASKMGVVEKLRSGSPILSVFQHMEQVQKAWSSSVKLNIELKAAYEEKDLQLSAALAQLAEVHRHTSR